MLIHFVFWCNKGKHLIKVAALESEKQNKRPESNLSNLNMILILRHTNPEIFSSKPIKNFETVMNKIFVDLGWLRANGLRGSQVW